MAVHRDETHFQIIDPNAKHYLVLDALNGTTQNSACRDVNGKHVRLNNQNNKGFLGYGSELKDKSIIVKSNLENNSPNVQVDDEDQITCRYSIQDSNGNTLVYTYDKAESDDDYPTVKLIIRF